MIVMLVIIPLICLITSVFMGLGMVLTSVYFDCSNNVCAIYIYIL